MSGPPTERPTGLGALLSRIHVAILLVAALVGWGLYSLYEIRKEAMPDVEVPLGLVQVNYPGAPPELVEAEVTNVMESKLKGLPRLARLDSSSMHNVALLLVEFDIDADMQESIDELRERVAEAEGELPDEVSSVSVKRLATTNRPIYSFSLSGDVPPEALRGFAIGLRDAMEGLEGVSEVRLGGLRDDQLQVLVHQERLDEVGGKLSDVVDALKKAQVATPVGTVSSSARNYSIDIDPLGLDIEGLGQLLIRSSTMGDGVPLSSVATLKRALSEPSEHTRLVARGPEGVVAGDAISFDVLRQPGADVPKVVNRVRARLDEARAELPASLTLTVTTDQGADIDAGLTELYQNGVQAVILVFVVLFLVLGVGESIIAGLSIPLTFLAVFGVLHVTDQSVNNLSLMALVIALGLLVDDFILIMEGMYEELQHGKTPLDAAVQTLRDFAVPSLSGSLTTIAAFLPIALLGGIEGRFIQIIPLTICIALVTSYLVSITIDAAFGAAVLRRSRPNLLTAGVQHGMDRLAVWYRASVFPHTVRTRAQRWSVLGVTVLAFAGSLGAATQLDSIVYPETDQNQLGATIYLAPGTSLEETRAVSAEVERALVGFESVRYFTLAAGAKSGLAMSSPQAYLEPFKGEHMLGITLQLVPSDQREKSSFELADDVRDALEALGRGEVEIHQVRMGASNSEPVEIEVTARSVERSEELADEVHAAAAVVGGLIGLKDTRKPHQGALRVDLDDEALAFHKLDRGSVLQFLFYAISGTTADVVYEGTDEIAIEVGYDWRNDGVWNSPASVDEVLTLQVPGQLGASVPLAGIADVDVKSSPIGINHLNRRHVVTVTADATGSPVEAADAIAAALAAEGLVLQPGEAIRFLGDKATSTETNRELGQALLLATALIFSILVVQFRSFTQPFIILVTVPLATTGVFYGFLATGIPMSFPATIGMVALAGIVVNDAIVLIDAINRGRWEEGLDPISAVLQGCVSRMRPIIVTTVTTVVGLLPLALTDPVWQGLCMAVVFGISLATVLTMVVIPALYLVLAGAGDGAPPSSRRTTLEESHHA